MYFRRTNNRQTFKNILRNNFEISNNINKYILYFSFNHEKLVVYRQIKNKHDFLVN